MSLCRGLGKLIQIDWSLQMKVFWGDKGISWKTSREERRHHHHQIFMRHPTKVWNHHVSRLDASDWMRKSIGWEETNRFWWLSWWNSDINNRSLIHTSNKWSKGSKSLSSNSSRRWVSCLRHSTIQVLCSR